MPFKLKILTPIDPALRDPLGHRGGKTSGL